MESLAVPEKPEEQQQQQKKPQRIKKTDVYYKAEN